MSSPCNYMSRPPTWSHTHPDIIPTVITCPDPNVTSDPPAAIRITSRGPKNDFRLSVQVIKKKECVTSIKVRPGM
ncbi:hypothetical protein ACTXT7_016216 [Hymenolepis weldensis]